MQRQAPNATPSRNCRSGKTAVTGLLAGDLGADGRAAGGIESADIGTGERVERAGEVVELLARVNRRPGSPLLARLDAPKREAAALYALSVEIVAGGGVAAAAEFGAERTGGGAPSREGRQYQALAWAEQLRCFEAAIGSGGVRLDLRGAVIRHRDLIRAVTVGGLSLPRVLESVGIKRSAHREKALKSAILAALDRMSSAISAYNPNTN